MPQAVAASIVLDGQAIPLGTYEHSLQAKVAQDLALLLHSHFNRGAGKEPDPAAQNQQPPVPPRLTAPAEGYVDRPEFEELTQAASFQQAVQQLVNSRLAEQLYYEQYSDTSSTDREDEGQAPGSAQALEQQGQPVQQPEAPKQQQPADQQQQQRGQQPEAAQQQQPTAQQELQLKQEQEQEQQEAPAGHEGAVEREEQAHLTGMDALLAACEEEGGSSEGDEEDSGLRGSGSPAPRARQPAPRRRKPAKLWCRHPQQPGQWALILSQSTIDSRNVSLPWAHPGDMGAELLGTEWVEAVRCRKKSGTARESAVLLDGRRDDQQQDVVYAVYCKTDPSKGQRPQYIERLQPLLIRHSAAVGDVLLLEPLCPGRLRCTLLKADSEEAHVVHSFLGYELGKEQQAARKRSSAGVLRQPSRPASRQQQQQQQQGAGSLPQAPEVKQEPAAGTAASQDAGQRGQGQQMDTGEGAEGGVMPPHKRPKLEHPSGAAGAALNPAAAAVAAAGGPTAAAYISRQVGQGMQLGGGLPVLLRPPFGVALPANLQQTSDGTRLTLQEAALRQQHALAVIQHQFLAKLHQQQQQQQQQQQSGAGQPPPHNVQQAPQQPADQPTQQQQVRPQQPMSAAAAAAGAPPAAAPGTTATAARPQLPGQLRIMQAPMLVQGRPALLVVPAGAQPGAPRTDLQRLQQQQQQAFAALAAMQAQVQAQQKQAQGQGQGAASGPPAVLLPAGAAAGVAIRPAGRPVLLVASKPVVGMAPAASSIRPLTEQQKAQAQVLPRPPAQHPVQQVRPQATGQGQGQGQGQLGIPGQQPAPPAAVAPARPAALPTAPPSSRPPLMPLPAAAQMVMRASQQPQQPQQAGNPPAAPGGQPAARSFVPLLIKSTTVNAAAAAGQPQRPQQRQPPQQQQTQPPQQQQQQQQPPQQQQQQPPQQQQQQQQQQPPQQQLPPPQPREQQPQQQPLQQQQPPPQGRQQQLPPQQQQQQQLLPQQQQQQQLPPQQPRQQPPPQQQQPPRQPPQQQQPPQQRQQPQQQQPPPPQQPPQRQQQQPQRQQPPHQRRPPPAAAAAGVQFPADPSTSTALTAFQLPASTAATPAVSTAPAPAPVPASTAAARPAAGQNLDRVHALMDLLEARVRHLVGEVRRQCPLDEASIQQLPAEGQAAVGQLADNLNKLAAQVDTIINCYKAMRGMR